MGFTFGLDLLLPRVDLDQGSEDADVLAGDALTSEQDAQVAAVVAVFGGLDHGRLDGGDEVGVGQVAGRFDGLVAVVAAVGILELVDVEEQAGTDHADGGGLGVHAGRDVGAALVRVGERVGQHDVDRCTVVPRPEPTLDVVASEGFQLLVECQRPQPPWGADAGVELDARVPELDDGVVAIVADEVEPRPAALDLAVVAGVVAAGGL